MQWSRRSFIKLGGVALGSVGMMGLLGCATEEVPVNANTANYFENEVEPATNDASTHTDTSDQNSGIDSTATAVVYFSATGNTKAVAEMIADAADAELMALTPKEPYTESELDYNNPDSRVSKEHDDPSAKPELAEPIPDLFRYSVVYLGYPIWWNEAPKIVDTFLEGSVNLSNTIIIPFCTSASSGIENSEGELKEIAPDANWRAGHRFAPGATKEAVDEWVEATQAEMN